MQYPGMSGRLSRVLNDDDNFTEGCRDIAAEIKGNHGRLLELVEGLQGVLTDTRPNMRERGVRILAQVIQLLPDDSLSESELNFILRFFTDRLKDHHSIIPATLKGILSILQMQTAPAKLPDHLLSEMGQHISCQAQLQSDRYTIYNIINQLVKKYPTDLKQLGPDFIYQVISNIDGEKDPRNLMFLFRMMPDFLKKFPLGHLAEEMFDVLACYFPVDFYSATNNPSSITRDQLAVALASCLTAVPEFSEFCLPLVFEKLESTRKEAKLDCFHLLKIGFTTFLVSAIEPYLPVVWKNIKSEVLPGIDKEVRQAALEALAALLRNLSMAPVSKNHVDLLTEVVHVVITDTQPLVKEIEMNAFLPSIQLLHCVAETSLSACVQVVTNVVPILQTQYYRAPNDEQKAIVLQAITSFLRICDIKGTISEERQELQQVLKESQSLYFSAAVTENEQVSREAVHGLSNIILFLDSNNRCKLYDILAACLKQRRRKTLREEAVACFKKLARMYADEIMNIMVCCKLQVFRGGGDVNFDEVYECCQLALCEIADAEPFTTFIVPQFLDLVMGSDDVKKQLLGINCLRKLVEVPSNESGIHNFLYEHCAAVNSLVSWCFHSVQEEKLDDVYCVELFSSIAKVLECIVRKQVSGVQKDVILQFVPWFLHPEECFKEGRTIFPLNPQSPPRQTQLVILLEGLLASVRQEVSLQCREQLIHLLTVLSIETTHMHTHRSASRLVGNLVNKAPDDNALSKSLATISVEVMPAMSRDACNLTRKHNAVRLVMWITKALVMRDHKDAGNWISTLIEVLHDDNVSTEVANGFENIMKENVDFLSQSNFCNIRLLFRQHLFLMVQTKLIESHHSAVSMIARCNHLLSLMHILQGVPRQVLLTDLPKIIPLLVESLKQQDVPLLLSTLETLCNLFEERQLDILDYVNTFITRLLLLSQFEQSMRVRILALQCLYHLGFYPTESILPYKDQIVRELCKCLDDKKRLVRLQAVRARSRWFVVGSPGEPGKP